MQLKRDLEPDYYDPLAIIRKTHGKLAGDFYQIHFADGEGGSHNSFWYKIDNLGYEGAAEFIASEILKLSNISNFVEYHLCEIKYHERTFHGCKSKDFLKDRRDTQIISVARLHEKFSSTDLDTALKKKSTRDQIDYLVNFVKEIRTTLEQAYDKKIASHIHEIYEGQLEFYEEFLI